MRRDAIVAIALLGGGLGGLVALATAAGCSYDRAAEGDVVFKESGTDDVSDAQVFEIGDDALVSRDKLCGDLDVGTCDPDRAEICTHLDAGIDGGSDASDSAAESSTDGAGPDAVGSGSTRACRVVKESNVATTACAPAGILGIDGLCSRDADCAPGLACIGTIPARCLPYCCGATPELDPCHATGRYCAALELAERRDKVPVCVQPDDCTLLQDPSEKCQKGTTCTVVTKYGDTSCVPVASDGSGLDLACCDDTHPCAASYACLGPSGARACRKLCHEGRDDECTPGACQKVSSIPAGFGVCSVGDAGPLDGGCKGGS